MAYGKYRRLFGKAVAGTLDLGCNLKDAKPQYRNLVILVGIHRWTGMLSDASVDCCNRLKHQTIYLSSEKSFPRLRILQIATDVNHPGNCLFKQPMVFAVYHVLSRSCKLRELAMRLCARCWLAQPNRGSTMDVQCFWYTRQDDQISVLRLRILQIATDLEGRDSVNCQYSASIIDSKHVWS